MYDDDDDADADVVERNTGLVHNASSSGKVNNTAE